MKKYQDIAEKLSKLDLNVPESIIELDNLLESENFSMFTEFVLNLVEPEGIDARLIEYIFKSDLTFEPDSIKDTDSKELNVSPDVDSIVDEFVSTDEIPMTLNAHFDPFAPSNWDYELPKDSDGNVIAANDLEVKKQHSR